MNFRRKGLNFEKQIAKKLSVWCNDTADVFYRTIGSGVLSTNALLRGDITTHHTDGFEFISKVFIECKYYEDLKLHSLFSKKETTKSIVEFWNKCKKQAKIHNTIPFLICKENYKSTFAVLPFLTSKEDDSLLVIQPFFNIFLYDFELFLKNNVYNAFLEKINNL